jgi:hypothetical protein
VHEVAEAAVLLLSILATQAEEGDEQTAARVEEAVIALIEGHLRGIRAERPPFERTVGPDAVLPVVPALAAITKRAARLAAYSDRRAVREAVIGAMRRLLRTGQEGDGLPSLLVGALLYETKESFPGLATLLWEAGVRAVETDDRNALLLARMAIEQRLCDGNRILTDEGVETAARLCVLAVWNDQAEARRAWEWYAKQSASADRDERILGALRIGSAALLAWNPSTALRVAFALSKEIELSALETEVRQPGFAMLEQTVADQFGHYLGPDAEAAFAKFLQFAISVRKAVPQPAPPSAPPPPPSAS